MEHWLMVNLGNPSWTESVWFWECKIHLRIVAIMMEKGNRREDCMLLILLVKLATAGLPDVNSIVLVREGEKVLAVTWDGYCSLRGSSGLCHERSFLPSVRSLSLMPQTLHYAVTDLLNSTTGPWAFPLQVLHTDLNETFLWLQASKWTHEGP